MTTAELAKRLAALEKTVEELKSQVTRFGPLSRRWWAESAGRFAGDAVFDEIVRLGREYRESLRPRPGRAKRDRS